MKIIITINGKTKEFEIDPRESLLDFLRREGYFGVKKGCESGDCGSCTIIMNGRAVKSCLLLVAQAHETEIITIEGIGTAEAPHPLQSAFVETGGIQCGFCVPGMILSAKTLLDKNSDPSEEEIKLVLSGNLCRCTGYLKQIEAVQLAAKRIRGE
ncbi:MAG: (2Fe-2S)-binding protein [Promethearchaeota archaeon]